MEWFWEERRHRWKKRGLLSICLYRYSKNQKVSHNESKSQEFSRKMQPLFDFNMALPGNCVCVKPLCLLPWHCRGSSPRICLAGEHLVFPSTAQRARSLWNQLWSLHSSRARLYPRNCHAVCIFNLLISLSHHMCAESQSWLRSHIGSHGAYGDSVTDGWCWMNQVNVNSPVIPRSYTGGRNFITPLSYDKSSSNFGSFVKKSNLSD